MSGPITAGFFLIHGTLILSAHALREARAMKREFGEVRDQLRAREDQAEAMRHAQQAARLERMSAIRAHADRQQARLERLRSVAETLAASDPSISAKIGAASPAAPEGEDDAEWTRFIASLDSAVSAIEAVLADARGRFAERLRATAKAPTSAATIDDVLSTYVLKREMEPGLDDGETERLRATAARILSRADLAQGSPLPLELEALARSIVLAANVDRAETLALELRHAVQRQREDAAAGRADAEEARRLLQQLPQDAPAQLVKALERVAARIDRFDQALRGQTQELLMQVAADRSRLEHEAAAVVLEESLKDLGYEVETIDSTLFVDGGTVHFHRPGWENYFVRLRVDPDERTVNFNVVRQRGDDESAERQRQDALAEDRWCAEFPRLMQTLAARGLQLDVTRRLSAGELPVQVVDRVGLQGAIADDADHARPSPLARRS